jgi:hypothetical protein
VTFALDFVDDIASSPNVRLILMGGSSDWQTLAKETDWGMPELRRAVAGTLLVDGQQYPASAYGNRVITLALNASHLSPDAAATKFQALCRELDRPHNFLRLQVDTTEVVFFRTFRSTPGSVVWDKFQQKATVRIAAEPFAYGLKETQSAQVVTNDPAAVSNGCYLDITGVKGDVETPAQVLLSGLNVGTFADIIIGTRRRGTPSSAAYFFQAEAMTMGVDTSVPGTDATMSGTTNNYARTTFATPTMTLRLSLTSNFPAASGIDLRGTYRMYAVVRGNGGTYQLQWAITPVGGGSVTVQSDVISVGAAASLRSLVDLGQIQFPIGADPVYDGYSGTEKSVTGGYFSIEAARITGATNLDWDTFILVPDDPARGDDWFSLSLYGLATNKDLVLDGPRDMVYPQNTAAVTLPVWYSPPWQGRIPRLAPNQTNRWIFLRPDKAGTDLNYGDVKTRTTTVTVSYWPRYLFVRPVGS